VKLEWQLFRTRVARRLLMLFAICALVPVGAYAGLTHLHVTKQLEAESHARLQRTGKALDMAIRERFKFAEAELGRMRELLLSESGTPAPGPAQASLRNSGPGRWIAELALATRGRVQEAENSAPFAGLGALSAKELEFVGQGETLLRTVYSSEADDARILLAQAIQPSDPSRGVLWGFVQGSSLWFGLGGEDSLLPPSIGLCVLDHGGRSLHCPDAPSLELREHVRQTQLAEHAGVFAWNRGGERLFVSHRVAFHRSNYLAPEWTIILTESTAAVLAPAQEFRRQFLLTTLAAVVIVILLSTGQIRRTLEPLEALRDGTNRIADGEFDVAVTVTSGDEFEDLARSFNRMANQLGRQFQVLSTIDEIDRAILGDLSTERIVDTVLRNATDVVPCQRVALTFLDSGTDLEGRTCYAEAAGNTLEEVIQLSPETAEPLLAASDGFLFLSPSQAPEYLDFEAFATAAEATFVVFPIVLDGTLSGILSFVCPSESLPDQDDLTRARQLADQVGVALANAQLVTRLEGFSWDTMRALARAIDAKSPWTAGHSERVTELCLQIGAQLGLGERDLDTLHRGALLHDIGKIGIPLAIVDKKGKLDLEEWNLIKGHPEIGARILSPIREYADIIPILLHHHERLDGTGYPGGLKGNEISLLARIVSVADVTDSLLSDRPYRRSLSTSDVVDFIQERSGSEFDPSVVDVAVVILRSRQRDEQRPGDGLRAASV